VSRIDGRQFSRSARRASDSFAFRKYTLPQNFKPATGIDLPAKMSAVQEPPRKRTAYIALGSNMGDRIGWIEKACNEMDARGIKVKRTSSLWETEPMYVLDQDRFVNGACEVRPPCLYCEDRVQERLSRSARLRLPLSPFNC
jgi:2-amino-4-hydroxy-6-hydroxymethyldihydropteridine diphosphokinase/dihydropteroate synthase